MTGSRESVLRRVRAALRDVSPDDALDELPARRTYRQSGDRQREEIVAHFAQRVSEYRATVRMVAKEELSESITAACRSRGIHRLVIPSDIPDGWIPAGCDVVRDRELTNAQLDMVDGVLTGCALAIAETGTIVLDSGERQGRRAITLIPDYHLCIVVSDQIVDVVPQAFQRLHEAVLDTGRPITFISGPSATSDIELNRIEGVHGPRTLDVLLIA